MSSPIMSGIRRNFVAGLLLILPLFMTVLILRFLFRIIMGLFSPILMHFYPDIPIWLKTLVSLAVLFIVIYSLGLLTSHFLGRWSWNRFEFLLMRIPLLRSIYSASREIVRVFHGPNRTGFKEVVMIEFPRAGMKSLGFVTGSVIDNLGNDCYKVFIPTTPNPTTGFLEIVEKSQVVRCNMSVEDGIRMIMSGGILGPESLCPKQHRVWMPKTPSTELNKQTQDNK